MPEEYQRSLKDSLDKAPRDRKERKRKFLGYGDQSEEFEERTGADAKAAIDAAEGAWGPPPPPPSLDNDQMQARLQEQTRQIQQLMQMQQMQQTMATAPAMALTTPNPQAAAMAAAVPSAMHSTHL